MSLSNYLELELLDHVTNVGAFTAPATLYVKLHTATPGEDGTLAAATETTRKAAAFTGPAAAGSISTSADISWTNVAATETYSDVSIWDAATLGNCIWYGALTAAKAIVAGDTFTIASGNLTLSLD